ncbi:S8 family serine peptidase [Kaistella jeonii]|uniref:S8 family serine peptidase n=1 Tax=Kaistella jeonii TaxID=266749 RepID=UPI000691FC2D|nr:S8 family serine peptidase [Kaistella jeonii]SFB70434.1 Trypsin-like peptidase domain-containing protein [Kaistella jeonii]VEI94817.1 Major intracellular serine protease precursor [Kaistella jeonii]
MSSQKIINDLAYERFQQANSKIDSVKKGIQENRMGEASLTDIQTDSDKLSKRIARENMPISAALERINGVPNFQDINILYKILKISESVGRITIKTRYGNSGYGTGFLVAPGILITNNHVFPDAETARNSMVQFYYELDENNESKKVQTFGFVPEKLFMTSSYQADPANVNSGLDFTIVAVSDKSKEGKNISEIPCTVLDETLGKIIEGENCVIIQHPKGDYKKTVMKDIRMLTLKDDFLIYESDTLPGSSGAVVIGLGTGEVVALHHSSIPNKNPQGQWLRKDGGVYKEGDADETINWLGNEGIRVSSLIRCIRNIKVPEEMSPLRNTILGKTQLEKVQKNSEESKEEKPETEMKNSNESVLNQAVNMIQNVSTKDNLPVQYFEIELSNILTMQDDWKENYKKLVPEAISSEPLFPLSTIPSQKIIQYITLRSNDNPWEIAAKLEALPQIKTATPDLEMETDLQKKSKSDNQLTESDMLENMKTSNAAGRQDDFKTKWSASTYFKLDDSDVFNQRLWNRTAVGLKIKNTTHTDVYSLIKDVIGYKNSQNKNKSASNNLEVNKIIENLKKINLVQLDTGYTDHAKVKGRFNFDCDEDFIDGSDARDEMRTGFLRHPGHGTRTASIITGGDMSSIYKNDGNYGILCDEKKNTLVNIIPYRISESVVLINRGKNVVDAVNQAVHTNADVMFMCMGTYPRPMIAEAAKVAYDNGVIWICASGNEVEMVVSPALYPGTIAVSATNPNQKPWRGSSYGTAVDISAPGEDVYVPSMDEKYNEIMVYGSGTSYATPHVAAAAALWKATKRDKIFEKYKFPWQIVEAFRICLKESATKPPVWDAANYGAGILNIYELLKCELPDIDEKKYAYAKDPRQEWDLGVREAVHFLWKTLLKKTISTRESSQEMVMTERSRIAITAMTGNTVSSIFEADSITSVTDSEKILKMYFDSYKKS